MPLVSVWKCPKTGKLFEDKAKYFKHLRSLGIANRIQRQKDVYRKEWQNLVNELNSCTTEQDIVQWIESHSKVLLMNAINNSSIKTRVPKNIDDFKIKVRSFPLKWENNIACTHSAPRGKLCNWTRDPKIGPTHYAGWTVHFEFGLSQEVSTFFSDLFKDTGLCTGTGSSWHSFEDEGIKYKGYHSYLTLWADDWPGLKVYHSLTQPE